jgi:FKBP-type peptidyl-prolyl cis-trans isomerase
MGKADTMDYISQGYVDRIEISLGNISRRPEDKFAIVAMKYVPASFKCELCGHEPCLYAYSIKNLETDIIIDVGSECVKHFRAKGCNIDVASGLKKRIKSVTRKMRRYMKNTLEEKEYKELTPEKRRELTVRLFMKHQAIEALKDNAGKKALLDKEDVLAVITDCPDIAPREKKEKVKKEKLSPNQKALAAAEKALAELSNKDLNDEDKKNKKKLQDKIRYYKNKVDNGSNVPAVPMAAMAS